MRLLIGSIQKPQRQVRWRVQCCKRCPRQLPQRSGKGLLVGKLDTDRHTHRHTQTHTDTHKRAQLVLFVATERGAANKELGRGQEAQGGFEETAREPRFMPLSPSSLKYTDTHACRLLFTLNPFVLLMHTVPLCSMNKKQNEGRRRRRRDSGILWEGVS